MRSLLRPAPRVVAGVAALAVLLPLGAAARPDRLPVPPYAQGIAAGIDGRPVVVPVDAVASHLDGTGVLAELDVELHRAVVADPVRAQESRDWLASGTVPGAGTRWEQMATRAMLDLDLLVLDNGAAAAGWNPNWRYVWPRDAAFVVAAYSVSG
ncbi:MAG: glycoside hydrolase family 15, partial [Actinomycetota bacterium]